MSKYDETMKRIENILGAEFEGGFEDALPVLCEYLQKNLQFPFEVKGIEDFGWEEPYVIGDWDADEYKQLKKTQPSYSDKYDLLSVDADSYSEWLLLSEDLIANVKRKSDKKKFKLGLAELKATDKKSQNYQLLDDYAVWFVNSR